MPVLHIVNKNHPNSSLQTCLEIMTPQDTLLLIEDGVYNLVTGSSGHLLIEHQPKHLRCCLLLPDVMTRGLSSRIPLDASLVTDEEFVALAVEHHKSVSWF